MSTETGTVAGNDTSRIHNIGYRSYDGVRLGRAYARRSLYSQTLRGSFGLGRSAKSKVLPMLLCGVMCLVSLILVAVAIATPGMTKLPIKYTDFAIYLQAVIGLFIASQAPQAVSRDLRFKSVPLYFSRPIERVDYVLAKFAAMTSALLILTGLPLVILFVGALLAKFDFADQAKGFGQGMVSVALLSVLFAGLGLVVAALTPRRGFGVAAVIAVLTITYGAVSTVQAIAWQTDSAGAITWLGLFSPITLIDGVQTAFLGATSAFPGGDGPGAADRRGLSARCSRARRRNFVRRTDAPLPEGRAVTTIEIDHTSRWFGNVVAVNDVSMTVGPGVTGLLGPNGAGKSTLINMMAGFLAPSTGTVTLDGTQIWRNESVYKAIGIVPEREGMYDFLTGREFVVANAELHGLGDAAAHKALATVEMEYAQDRKISTYSKGMRQRVKMASALVHDPSVLLLDEPFNGMDPRQRMQLMELLRRMGAEGRTVLFSSHILEEVEQLASHIEVIVAGRHAASGDFRKIHAADDRPAAPLSRPVQRRPRARRRAHRRSVDGGDRGRHHRGSPADPGRRLRTVHRAAAEGRARTRHPAAHRLPVRRVPRIGLFLSRSGLSSGLKGAVKRHVRPHSRPAHLPGPARPAPGRHPVRPAGPPGGHRRGGTGVRRSR